MQEYNFAPRKSKKSKAVNMIERDKAVIVIFLLIFSALIYSYFRLLDIKKVEQQKYYKFIRENKQTMENKPSESREKSKTISAANVFLKDIDNFVEYTEVNIEGNQIRCQFGMKNDQDYYKLISSLEKNNKYKLKEISPLKKNSGEGSSAEVLLEVVK